MKMEHYVEKKGNVWVPRQEPINGRNIGHKVVCERLGAYEASEMTPGAVIAMKRACGSKTSEEIEELLQAESEGRLVVFSTAEYADVARAAVMEYEYRAAMEKSEAAALAAMEGEK